MNIEPNGPIDLPNENSPSPSTASHLKTVSLAPRWWTKDTKKIAAICGAFWLAAVVLALICHTLGLEHLMAFSVYVAASATVTFLGYAVAVALLTRCQTTLTEPGWYPEGVDYRLPEKESVVWPSSPDESPVYITNVFCQDYGGCEYCPGQGLLSDVMGDPNIPSHIKINCIHSCHEQGI